MPNTDIDASNLSNLKFRKFKPTEIRTAIQLLNKTLTADEKKRGFFRVYARVLNREEARTLGTRLRGRLGVCDCVRPQRRL